MRMMLASLRRPAVVEKTQGEEEEEETGGKSFNPRARSVTVRDDRAVDRG
jgi:hypothetical protein